MLLQILRGLDVLLGALVLFDIASVGPGVDELHDIAVTALGTVDCREILLGESVGKELEHVLRTEYGRHLFLPGLLTHLLAIEMQFAPANFAV